MPRKMKVTSVREVYRCPLFWVTEEEATNGAGHEIKRAIVRHGGSAVILLVDEKKRVLLVRQYRLPAGQFLWELPAGKLDEGEKPLQTAKRELKEETGYKAGKWSKLVSYYASPGFVAEKMNVFLAENPVAGEPSPMEDEQIETRWFSGKEMDELIRNGQILDGKTLAGYLLWKRYR